MVSGWRGRVVIEIVILLSHAFAQPLFTILNHKVFSFFWIHFYADNPKISTIYVVQYLVQNCQSICWDLAVMYTKKDQFVVPFGSYLL